MTKRLITAMLILSSTSFAQTVLKPEDRVLRAGLAYMKVATALRDDFDAGEACVTNAFPEEIVQVADKARSLVESAKFTQWYDLTPKDSKMRANLAWRRLATWFEFSAPSLKPQNLVPLLAGTKFFSRGGGVYGTEKKILLNADMTASIESLVVPAKEGDPIKYASSKAVWELIGVNVPGTIELRLKIDSAIYQFNFAPGEILLEPQGGAKVLSDTFSSSESLCDS